MKNVNTDLSAISQVDWTRLAAFIDGEGCIHISSQVHKPPFEGRGRYDYIKITISNTNPILGEWLLKMFGGHVRLCRRNSERWKASFHWVLGSAKAAAVLERCQPYFLLKSDQATLAVAFQRTMCRCGVKGTSSEVLNHREQMKTKMHALNARGPRAIAVNE